MNATNYNGWTNYETWAVKLWIDNDRNTYEYWRNVTRQAWHQANDQSPNPYMNKHDNAQQIIADQLKDEHDDQSEHPIFAAANGTVYADLLNAALADVNWHEIAASLLDDRDDDDQ